MPVYKEMRLPNVLHLEVIQAYERDGFSLMKTLSSSEVQTCRKQLGQCGARHGRVFSEVRDHIGSLEMHWRADAAQRAGYPADVVTSA